MLHLLCILLSQSRAALLIGGALFALCMLTLCFVGKNKKQKQISGIDNAYVIKDDIEYGYQNVIPLWAFGFLY